LLEYWPFNAWHHCGLLQSSKVCRSGLSSKVVLIFET
jgi:hypothetical protein